MTTAHALITSPADVVHCDRLRCTLTAGCCAARHVARDHGGDSERAGSARRGRPGGAGVVAATVDDVLAGRAPFAVVCGDATAVMEALPEGCAHVTYCDPPYGLSAQSTDDVIACLQTWLAGKVYTHGGKGFMAKDWDAFVPGPEAWRAAHRALRPGGYCVAFSSTRTVDLLGIAVRLAGFEQRQGWAYLFGQGFPKSLNVSMACDREAGAERVAVGERANVKNQKPMNGGAYIGAYGGDPPESFPITAPSSDAAKQWDGYGTDVKPSYEPLVVARKALGGTVAHNVTTHGCGALNIDAARIGTAENQGRTRGTFPLSDDAWGNGHLARTESHKAGRFPASLALVHDEGCVCEGTRRVRGSDRPGHDGDKSPAGMFGLDNKHSSIRHADPDGMETVDAWHCTPTCAVAELGRQSGERTSGSGNKNTGNRQNGTTMGSGIGRGNGGGIGGDTGTAARFFYQAKASARDRLAFITCTAGCAHHESVAGVREARLSARDPSREHPHGFCRVCSAPRDHYQHPTVKPLELARYHARLLSLPAHTRPVALVPFCGTGIEARALLEVGFRVIAIDLDPRHCAMTAHRLGGSLSNEAVAVKVMDATKQPGLFDAAGAR